jgi:peptidoglycan hydrolase-like protein with peptidoglycan-binding domain
MKALSTLRSITSDFSTLPVISVERDNPPAFVIRLKQLLKEQGFWDRPTDNSYYGEVTQPALRQFQLSHVDQDGKYLLADGVVGPKTWWALANPSGPEQRNFISGPEGITIANPSRDTEFNARYGKFSLQRQAFIRLLFYEHSKGVREIPDGSNKGGEVNKYLQSYGPSPWCALFQSWAYTQVTGNLPLGSVQAHVQTWYNLAKRQKMITDSPVPGDLAVWFFDKGAGHVSAVVADSGRHFNTIGGNEGNRVKLGLRDRKREPSLKGFIRLFDDNPPTSFKRTLLLEGEQSVITSGNSR